MAGRLFPPGYQAIDGNGAPMSGALLYFYESGTSTPQDTYTDDDLATANANPVVADSAGRFGPIFGGSNDYKAILKTSAGVTVFTADPVTAPGATAAATQSEVDTRTSTTKFVTPATLADGLGSQGSSITAAAALTLPTVGDYFTVTGSTAITSISTRTAGREIVLRFAGSLTLTHNATSLIIPTGASIVTAAGDVARLRSEGSGNWRLVDYTFASLLPSGVVSRSVAATDIVNTTTATDLVSFTVPANILGTSRKLVLELDGDYLNNSGSSANLTITADWGSGTSLPGTGALSQAANANRRSLKIRIEIMAKNATNSQFCLTQITLGNASGDVSALATPAVNVQGAATATEDTTTSLTFRIQATHGTANSNISCRLHHAQLRLE